MFRILLLLFIAIPILEIYLLIKVGERIGLLSTLLTIVLTAIVGASLVRREWIKTINSLQNKLQNNQTPGKELADGAMLLLAGVLLVTPGFFTDGVGFALAFPLTRALLRKKLVAILVARVQTTHQGYYTQNTDSHPANNSTVEGEFHSHPNQEPSTESAKPDEKQSSAKRLE